MGYSNGISQREKFLRVDFGWMGNSLSLYVTQGWAKIRVCAQRVSDPVAPTGLLYRHYLLKKKHLYHRKTFCQYRSPTSPLSSVGRAADS
jgi:hypothetical protein